MNSSRFAALLLAVPAAAAFAQAPPGTDVHLAPLAREEGVLQVGALVNVTDRPGYDNQPFFTPDGRGLLYSSQRDGQTDVYRHLLETGETEQVTDTPESEYSPTPLPDGSGISVVRVEADERQRLWRFDPDGGGAAVLLKDVEPVGYHAWVDEHRVALFVLGEPHTLRLADLRTGAAETIDGGIGRALHRVPGKAWISYTARPDTSGPRWVRVLDPETKETDALAAMSGVGEDLAWTPWGSLLTVDGTVLKEASEASGWAWTEVADLADFGLAGGITRIAVSPAGDRLAVVAEEPAPETD